LETSAIFTQRLKLRYLQTRFLAEADKFIAGLDPKAAKKIIYNIDLAEQTNDPKLFKKLQKDIWELRTKFLGQQIRLLAFWDKTGQEETLVIATHGFIKKVDKIPVNEIERAVNIRKKYFERKQKNSAMAKTAMKSYSLAEMKNKYIGKAGTKGRDGYEYELNMEVLSYMIKKARQERNLTQEQLGKLVGVQKAQISKLETGANSATIDTLLKVFKALKADIHFNVTLENRHLQLS
jgi:HTH-type transcriptional regulator / antitoxin HipB